MTDSPPSIAIIGGTGALGGGLAARWARAFQRSPSMKSQIIPPLSTRTTRMMVKMQKICEGFEGLEGRLAGDFTGWYYRTFQTCLGTTKLQCGAHDSIISRI